MGNSSQEEINHEKCFNLILDILSKHLETSLKKPEILLMAEKIFNNKSLAPLSEIEDDVLPKIMKALKADFTTNESK